MNRPIRAADARRLFSNVTEHDGPFRPFDEIRGRPHRELERLRAGHSRGVTREDVHSPTLGIPRSRMSQGVLRALPRGADDLRNDLTTAIVDVRRELLAHGGAGDPHDRCAAGRRKQHPLEDAERGGSLHAPHGEIIAPGPSLRLEQVLVDRSACQDDAHRPRPQARRDRSDEHPPDPLAQDDRRSRTTRELDRVLEGLWPHAPRLRPRPTAVRRSRDQRDPRIRTGVGGVPEEIDRLSHDARGDAAQLPRDPHVAPSRPTIGGAVPAKSLEALVFERRDEREERPIG